METTVDYQTYKQNKGQLNEREFEAARRYSPTESELDSANQIVADFINRSGGYRPEGIDGQTVGLVAQLVGATENRIPKTPDGSKSDLWILTETYALRGLNPESLFTASMGNLMSALAGPRAEGFSEAKKIRRKV